MGTRPGDFFGTPRPGRAVAGVSYARATWRHRTIDSLTKIPHLREALSHQRQASSCSGPTDWWPGISIQGGRSHGQFDEFSHSLPTCQADGTRAHSRQRAAVCQRAGKRFDHLRVHDPKLPGSARRTVGIEGGRLVKKNARPARRPVFSEFYAWRYGRDRAARGARPPTEARDHPQTAHEATGMQSP